MDRLTGESTRSTLEFRGIRSVINAAGPATRLGGMPLSACVVDAMQEASEHCFRMEELQRAAGSYLASAFGTEDALVTCGAGAGLALAVAACIARYDVARMNALPLPEAQAPEVMMLRAQRYPYDHLVRLTGARIIDVGYYEDTRLYEIEQAINERTVAFLFYPTQVSPTPELRDIVEVCHRHGVPVIVDAALELVPPILERRWLDAGADMILCSGGKVIGGPQASGILCGRQDLVDSARLQMLDMDVRVPTWVDRTLLDHGHIAGPPQHGIGRSMKVGKEEIFGLVAAVQSFLAADHAQRAKDNAERLRLIGGAFEGIPGFRVTYPNGEEFCPRLMVDVDEQAAGKSVWQILHELQEGDRPVHLNESMAWEHKLLVDVRAVSPGDEIVVRDEVARVLGRP
jgi:D-glucosaminate-6-phosphate ammonia-lyase